MTRRERIESYHSFSFGDHYDSANVRWGPLVAVNEERVAAGGGFGTHPHRGVDIITWVLSGRLEHVDEIGGASELEAGEAALLHAGAGANHAERAAGTRRGVTFVQMWLTCPQAGRPSYERARIGQAKLAPVAGPPPAPLGLHTDGARLYLASLRAGDEVSAPVNPLGYLHVLSGEAVLGDGERLGAGDSARLSGSPAPVRATAPAQLLVWELPQAEPPD